MDYYAGHPLFRARSLMALYRIGPPEMQVKAEDKLLQVMAHGEYRSRVVGIQKQLESLGYQCILRDFPKDLTYIQLLVYP